MPKECPQEALELVEHLRSTGTGKSKLEAVKKLATECESSEEFLKKVSEVVPEGTVEKINAYLATEEKINSYLAGETSASSNAPTEEASEVAAMNAADSIDAISRMVSIEKLEHIALTDVRKTVREAAEKRISHLAETKP